MLDGSAGGPHNPAAIDTTVSKRRDHTAATRRGSFWYRVAVSDGFDPGPRPGSALGSSSGFNVGKFLGLTAALAVGAGVGAGAYYGVKATSSSEATQPAVPEPTPAPEPEAKAGPKLDVPAGPKLDVPAVDEPSDPNALRLDVPSPWGLPGSDAPKPAPGGGGGGGVTQETF